MNPPDPSDTLGLAEDVVRYHEYLLAAEGGTRRPLPEVVARYRGRLDAAIRAYVEAVAPTDDPIVSAQRHVYATARDEG
jgi:hypothetical protein